MSGAPAAPLTLTGLAAACTALGATPPDVWAVLTVETAAFGFLPDRRPRILFERHVFHRLTHGRFDAGHRDISNTTPGGYAGNALEYARLEAAIALDRDAALQSTSWGIGQVMGFNCGRCGYHSASDMVTAMLENEDNQLLAVARFIADAGLHTALAHHDWSAFARGYNGAAYRKNKYDTRLAAAHGRFAGVMPNLAIRAAQAALLFLGVDPGAIDGFVGPLTRRATRIFQERELLPITGALDLATRSRLVERAFG